MLSVIPKSGLGESRIRLLQLSTDILIRTRHFHRSGLRTLRKVEAPDSSRRLSVRWSVHAESFLSSYTHLSCLMLVIPKLVANFTQTLKYHLIILQESYHATLIGLPNEILGIIEKVLFPS